MSERPSARGSSRLAEPPSPHRIKQLEVVYRLTDAVRRGGSLEEVYQAALEGIGRALDTERASILVFDDHRGMGVKAWRGLSDGYRRAVEGHSPWSRDAADPEPILVPDVLEDPSLAPYRDTISGEGIRALAFIPLVSRSRLVGKFMVYHDRPHAFGADEVRLARAIASHIAFAVDRRQAEEKLALYREIFANSSDAIAVIDAQGVYLEQNAAHRDLTGYPDEELEGRTPAIHLGETRFVEIAQALAADGVYKGDVESTTRSGERRDLELSAFTVRDEAGQPRCYVGIKRDIAERKRIEETLSFLAGASVALDRSLDFDATVRELVGLAVPRLATWALVDLAATDGRLVHAAAAHADPERGGPLARLLDGRGGAPFEWAAGVYRSGKSGHLTGVSAFLPAGFAGENEIAPILGELGALSAIAVPLSTHDRVLGVLTLVSADRFYDERDLALAEDLARRAAAALDNARLFREAQESDRRKEEFLAVLAHELRNPLAPILTSLEVMASPEAAAEARTRSREVVERQVRNLSRLIDDLLDVSRITRGKIELRRQAVELKAVVDHAVETVRSLFERRDVALAAEVEPGIRLDADPLRLEQVVTNLLSNAAKYTPPGGSVWLSGRREPDGVRLGVRDDGAGISSEMLPRIFEPFVQGDDPKHPGPAGLGIGLTLARGLVELHGGTLEATSAGVGRGSEFVVRLPAAAAAPAAAAEAPSPPAPRPAGAKRTLVVDDNRDAAIALGELLRLKGHEVEVAHDGHAAVAAAARLRPDVVLLDIGLPDIDGYEVAQRLRALPGLEPARIVAISGYGQEHFRSRSLSLGFAAHLVKPVLWSELERLLAV